MASKRTIKRILLTTVWSVIAGGVITLLVAANGRQQPHVCNDVLITVQGTGERYFISKSDIAGMIRSGGEPTLIGRRTEQIDLAHFERKLESNVWIQDAELYFDRASDLHVIVTERQPIARAFATNGSSFYIDSSGARLPLLSHISARVPVITGYPSGTRPLAKDSAVLQGVRKVVEFISADDFWSAQIAQIDIMPNRSFELLPTIGNHIIRIGNADDLEEKLGRLMVLYKQVLSKTGFDKYSVLDVQYAGQVVALHRGADATVDSGALKQNIAELLRTDQMMQAHAAAQTVTATPPVSEPVTTTSTAAPERTTAVVKPEVKKAEPVKKKADPVKPATQKPKPAAKQGKTTTASKAKPKAVMPKRN